MKFNKFSLKSQTHTHTFQLHRTDFPKADKN